MQLLYSISLRFHGRYHPSESKCGLHPLFAIMNSKPASMAAATLSQLKNSPSALTKTCWTQPGKWFLIFAMKVAASLPLIVSPLRSLPIRYSLVSSIKQRTGRYPFLPRFFLLCPLRPPCWLPKRVSTVVSILIRILKYLIPHNCQTRSRRMLIIFKNEFAWLIPKLSM